MAIFGLTIRARTHKHRMARKQRTIDDDDDENNDKEPKRHEVRQGSAKELDNSRTRKHCEKREIS